MSIDESLRGFAMLGAQWVLWLLVGLSVVAVAIVVERVSYLVVSADDHKRLRADIRALLSSGQVEKARRRLDESPSCEARILGAGLGATSVGEAEERMTGESELQRLQMERRIAFLGTLGNNAPFIGLLGTVIGIIGAFHQLDASQGRLSAGLMAEIGEALVATAIGLVVALPAVAAFNAFQRVIRVRLARANALGRELLANFHAAQAVDPAE
jgi:biopolymer transport protein ExbB